MQRAGLNRCHRGRGPRFGNANHKGASHAGMFETIGFGGAGIPRIVTYFQLAVPITKPQIIKPCKGCAVRGDGAAWPFGGNGAQAFEILYPAMAQPDADAPLRRGGRHLKGQVTARVSCGAGRRQQIRTAKVHRRSIRHQHNIVRPVARNRLPQLACREAVVVTRHKHPCDIRGLRHRIERLPGDRRGRCFLIKCIPCQQNMRCTRIACGNGQTVQHIMAHLTQTPAHVFCMAAKRLAKMQIRTVQKAEHYAIPPKGKSDQFGHPSSKGQAAFCPSRPPLPKQFTFDLNQTACSRVCYRTNLRGQLFWTISNRSDDRYSCFASSLSLSRHSLPRT